MKNFEVEICSSENINQDWYVYIYDTNQQKIIQKFYKGINVDYDANNRRIRCEALKESIEKELKSGWVPKSKKKQLPQPEDKGYNIIEAFDIAFKIFDKKVQRKEMAPKTLSDYSSIYKYLKIEITSLEWQIFDIKDFSTYHIKLLLEGTKERQKWSNKRYNKASDVLRSIFTILKKEFIVKSNPAHGLEYLNEEEPEPIDLFTPKEQTRIINHFKTVCPRFNIFLKIIHQIGIRPGEIRDLKCSMVDFEKNMIVLPKEITKNDKIGLVPITDDLKEDLLSLGMDNPDYYIFGIESPYCRRKEKLFLPSPYQISKNVAGNIWRDNIHKKLHIYKKMYWFKHKGANDKEANGMPLHIIKELLRHSGENITKIYATKRQERVLEEASALIPKFE